MSTIHAINSTVETTTKWLSEIATRLEQPDHQRAYQCLRAVLHTLRDRMNTDQVAALSSQLPMLIRGIFFEGWHPSGKPLKLRNQADFLDRVAGELPASSPPADTVTRVVLDVLSHHVSNGEVQKLKASMPPALRELFSSDYHTLWF